MTGLLILLLLFLLLIFIILLREFDAFYAFEKARPMTPAERAEERTLRRGRPKIGQGAKKISISLERGVLRDADALARKKGVKRSELIASFVVAGLKRSA